MCLIVLAWKAHPDYHLIVAANRDEFHARPTKTAHWWPDHPDILAGRDLQAGGTWLGLSRSGRFAAVTNYRERQRSNYPRTRGELVREFLATNISPPVYSNSLAGEQYSGFSLLTSTADELAYTSNRGDRTVVLEPGIYGLSNASLDTPWTKLQRTKNELQALLDRRRVNSTQLLQLLDDRTPAPVSEVQSDDLPFELARSLSATFIVRPEYGTRCSSVILLGNDGRVQFTERSFDNTGAVTGNEQIAFQASV